VAATPLWGSSYYTVRLDDSKAVYLTRDSFPVHGDGVADDTNALQQAIDKVQETTGQGIVFVPEGRYRLSKTIYIWPGIRVIGYGTTRPVMVLGENTPGYQDKDNENLMVFFAGGRPGAGRGLRGSGAPGQAPGGGRGGAGGQPPDAGAGTFYSALSNIDLEIQDGNPGAVGVRAHYAQHCFLAHMDFHIGSGLAAIHEGGNVAEDVHFYGGRYGIWTRTPSPGWQFTVVDATFEGQREAAIQERAAGLTLIRPRFRDVPTAIAVDPGFPDDLWVKDARMENVSGPAIVVSLENSARTEINMENVVCNGVPTFAAFRESGRKVAAPAAMYQVKVFSHGLNYADIGANPEIKDIFESAVLSAMPVPVESDLPDLPARDTWVNIRSLGARGDGSTDDTEAFRKAIAQHRTIYLPTGVYVVGDTIALRPDTVLIGLHPSATQIDLLDSTPAFQGVGSPKPMIEAPKNGTNILIGIGLYTNGINPRAVAAKWMAGKNSMMNDVRFLGGHGTNKLDGSRDNPYNNTHTADPDLNRRWDGQYPSLWVTDGGGGTFFDIWTPSTFAQAGMLVSDTSTPRAGLRNVERASRPLRSATAQRLQLAVLRAANRRGARRGRFRAAAGNRWLEQHHRGQLPHLSRDQHLSTVPLGHQGRGFEKHPVPQHPLLQQQQSFVRRRGLRPDAQRRRSPAGVCVADPVGRRAAWLARRRLPRCWPPAPGWKDWREASSTSPAERPILPAISTLWTPIGSASTAGRGRAASSPRCATIRWTRSTWPSIGPAT
jgi:hypothetical protein